MKTLLNVKLLWPLVTAGLLLGLGSHDLRAQICENVHETIASVDYIRPAKGASIRLSRTVGRGQTSVPVELRTRLFPGDVLRVQPAAHVGVKLEGDTKGTVEMGPQGLFTLRKRGGVWDFTSRRERDRIAAKLRGGCLLVEVQRRWLTIWGTEVLLSPGDQVDSVYVKKGCISIGNEFLDIDLRPTFRWSAPDSGIVARQAFELYDESETRLLFDSTLSAESNAFNLPPGFELAPSATYHWRIRAENSAGVSRWSDFLYFRTIVPPEQIDEVYPPDSARGQSLRPDFGWIAPPGESTQFRIQIASDEKFTTNLIDEAIDRNWFKPAESLRPASVYHWRVRAVNAAGSGPWSTQVLITDSVRTTDSADMSDSDYQPTVDTVEARSKSVQPAAREKPAGQKMARAAMTGRRVSPSVTSERPKNAQPPAAGSMTENEAVKPVKSEKNTSIAPAVGLQTDVPPAAPRPVAPGVIGNRNSCSVARADTSRVDNELDGLDKQSLPVLGVSDLALGFSSDSVERIKDDEARERLRRTLGNAYFAIGVPLVVEIAAAVVGAYAGCRVAGWVVDLGAVCSPRHRADVSVTAN